MHKVHPQRGVVADLGPIVQRPGNEPLLPANIVRKPQAPAAEAAAADWHDATFDAATDAARAQQKRISDLERTVKRRDDVIAGLRQQLADALRLSDSLRDEVAEARQELAVVTGDRNNTRDDFITVRDELIGARERVAQLEGDLAATRNGTDAAEHATGAAVSPAKPRTARTAGTGTPKRQERSQSREGAS